MTTRTLPAAAQTLLDGLLNDDLHVWWDGKTFIAGNRRGAQRAYRVGRAVASLRARGLVTESGAVILTDDGMAAATVRGDRAEVERAYRLRVAPPEVLRREPLMPHPVYPAPEPKRVTPREGYATHDLSDRLTADLTSVWGPDQWDVDVVLRVTTGGRFANRHGVGFFGPDGVTRHKHGGPLLKGVYAYAFALSTVIDNHGGTGREMREDAASGRMIDVEIGDVIDIRGYMFVIERSPNDNIRLSRLAVE